MKTLAKSSFGSMLLGYTAGTAFVLAHMALHGMRSRLPRDAR